MGEYPIPSHPLPPSTHNSHSPYMSDVNAYYLGTPRCILAAELNSGLITETEA